MFPAVLQGIPRNIAFYHTHVCQLNWDVFISKSAINRFVRQSSSFRVFTTFENIMEQTKANPVDFSVVDNLAINHHKKLYDGVMQYGTAGFRTKASILDHVLYRMGLFSVLRSQFKKACIGLMITASHNPEGDNGVKLVDPGGEMLESSWEATATKLANVPNEQVVSTLRAIIKEHNIDTTFCATVIIGRDTRESSLPLSCSAIKGVEVMNGNLRDVGVVTTPQLHYLVVCTNTNGAYGVPSLEGYYKKISQAFKSVVRSQSNNKYIAKLQLDAANGVGAIAVKDFQKHLSNTLEIEAYNNGDGELNYLCGADYVKIQQVPPKNIPLIPFLRSVSIDGDADRVVYFYTDEQGKFHLLDGDRIATLFAAYLKELVSKSQLNLQLGLVQTAYANGGSTAYISESLQVPVACVPTGVKHLHHKALEFDIGVYFEANGHGTVVFKSSAVKAIRHTAANDRLPRDQQVATQTLSNIIDVINQTVGDALSDMLLVELILHAKGWDAQTWESIYDDLPNKQVKVKVQDRNEITTADAERRCITPSGLQEKIDEIVAKYKRGRSFVRPSGTEDIVRVYAECEKESDVEKLAVEVSMAVYDLASGIGPRPVL